MLFYSAELTSPEAQLQVCATYHRATRFLAKEWLVTTWRQVTVRRKTMSWHRLSKMFSLQSYLK